MRRTGFTPEIVEAVKLREVVCALRGVSECSGDLVANHRSNRGMGGSKTRNTLDNACLLCWRHNDLIETNPEIAAVARRRGVKLTPGLDSLRTPFWAPFWNQWVVIDENGDLRLTGDAVLTPEEVD